MEKLKEITISSEKKFRKFKNTKNLYEYIQNFGSEYQNEFNSDLKILIFKI